MNHLDVVIWLIGWWYMILSIDNPTNSEGRQYVNGIKGAMLVIWVTVAMLLCRY